ncbi:hypothetical protein [Thiolapillus sp.]
MATKQAEALQLLVTVLPNLEKLVSGADIVHVELVFHQPGSLL